jgi:hypothetical protein
MAVQVAVRVTRTRATRVAVPVDQCERRREWP